MKANRLLTGLLSVVVLACTSSPPPPTLFPVATTTPAPTGEPQPSAAPTPAVTSAPSATPPPKSVGDLALEECDPLGYLPCEHQALVLVEPVAASGVSLTYSTEWADGRSDRPTWNASSLGLGGWSLDVLHRYDAASRILLMGDGSWRVADAVEIGGGQSAVPSYDGFRYFVFDSAWRHVRTVDTVTGADLLTFSYDPQGRFTGVRGQGPDGPVELTAERTEDGALLGLLGLGGTRTGILVGPDGAIAAVSRTDATAANIGYGAFGLVTSWQESGRGPYSFEYDASGRMTSFTDPDGVTVAQEFDSADGAVTVAITDENGGVRRVRSERTDAGLRRTVTDVDGTVTLLDRGADGALRLEAADGTVTAVSPTAHARWGLAAPVLTSFVEVRPNGTEYRVETQSTMGTGAQEPGGGAWQATVLVDGETFVTAYEPLSRTLTRTDPSGRQSEVVFDEHARVVSRRAAGEPPAAFAYDDMGRLASHTLGEGASAATTSYAYDADNGEVTRTNADGSVVQVRYDGYGSLRGGATETEQISFSHDAAGAVLQLFPGEHPSTSIGYSEAGRETAFIPPAAGNDASHETVTYTPAGLVEAISGPGDRRIEMGYDAAGRSTSWTFDRGTSSAAYDGRSGLLASNASPDGVATAFEYDGSTLNGLEWSGPVTGSVGVALDGQLRYTEETVNGADPVAYAYDEAGLLSSIGDLGIERDVASGLPIGWTLGGAQLANEYDADGRLSATTATANGETVLVVRYTRDAQGRVISVERAGAGGEASTTTYTYDSSGRLSGVSRGDRAETYEYDASGNRVAVTGADGETARATFDDRDRLLTDEGTTVTYDADGTLAQYVAPAGTTRFDFDDLGALRSVVRPDGDRIDYVIDAGGRRIGRMVNGVMTDGYLYSVDDLVAAWLDGSGNVVARFSYDDSGRLVLVTRGAQQLLVVTDQIGSPIALIDSTTGEVVEQLAYDAWGNFVDQQGRMLDASPSRLIPFGFAGGLVDPLTKLVHFGARDYDPVSGRWTAPDPLRYGGGDLNLYRYAAGDPVNLVDPTGTFPKPLGGGKPSGTIHRVGGGGHGSSGSGATGKPAGGGGKSGPYKDSGPSKPPSSGNQPPTAAPGPKGPGGSSTFPDNPSGGNKQEKPSTTDSLCIGVACQPLTPGGPAFNGPSAPGGGGCLGVCVPIGPPGSPVGVCLLLCDTQDPAGNSAVCLFACVYGDPHAVTGDSLRVGFQAAGEFIAAKSPDGTLELQARFEPAAGRTDVTLTSALALASGSDRVAFYTDPARELIVNGEVVDGAVYSATLPGGTVIERQGARTSVVMPDGSTLYVDSYGRWMNFSLVPADGIAPDLVGVFGDRDGDRSNDLTTRDGVVIDPDDPNRFELLHGQFADSWRVTQEESLFDYLPGESTETFTRRDIPSEPATVESVEAETRQEAERLCRAMGVTSDPVLSDCIVDVGLTGNPTYAGSAASVDAAMDRSSGAHDDPGDPIELGQTVAGELLAGAVDRYVVSVDANQIVYLDAHGDCVTDVSWRLVRPDGGTAAFDRVCTDLGRRVLATGGNWSVEIYSDNGAAAGAYEFQVIEVAPVQENELPLDRPVEGATTAVGDRHRYTLNANADDVVFLDALGDCVDGLNWQLLRPDGGLADFAPACEDLGRSVLEEPGDWTVEIYSDGTESGPYAFEAISAPSTQILPLSVGEPVTGETHQVAEWHRHTFDAAAGDVVYLDALGECVPDLYWRLLRPDGGLRDFATTCTDIGREVLDFDGSWTIEVYSDTRAFGAYSFSVIAAPRPVESTISVGQSVNGTIAQIGEWHRYTFAATAGQSVFLDAMGECRDDLWWRLLGPGGGLRTFANICTDMGQVTIDETGSWTIEIYSDGMATGAYSVALQSGP